jgi:hypothetical protein
MTIHIIIASIVLFFLIKFAIPQCRNAIKIRFPKKAHLNNNQPKDVYHDDSDFGRC